MIKAFIAIAAVAGAALLGAQWLEPDCSGRSSKPCVDVKQATVAEPGAISKPVVPSRSVASSDESAGETDAQAAMTEARVTDTRLFLAPHQVKQATAEAPQLGRVESLLNVPSQMSYGDFVWDESGIDEGPIAIRIDLARQIISVFRDGHEIGTAVIVYGTDGHPTPLGYHPIRGKKRYHHSRAYDAPMPYTMWLTTDGVAIHASDVLRGRATHGCIGVPPKFAAKLFAQAAKGDAVVILPA